MSDHSILGIDTHAYLVKEPARAIAFWRDTMGLNVTWESPQGAEFELPDGAAFGLWKMDDGPWITGNGVMFGVADVHAAAQHYRGKGVTVSDVMEMPSCNMAVAEDSEGNQFILHQRKT